MTALSQTATRIVSHPATRTVMRCAVACAAGAVQQVLRRRADLATGSRR